MLNIDKVRWLVLLSESIVELPKGIKKFLITTNHPWNGMNEKRVGVKLSFPSWARETASGEPRALVFSTSLPFLSKHGCIFALSRGSSTLGVHSRGPTPTLLYTDILECNWTAHSASAERNTARENEKFSGKSARAREAEVEMNERVRNEVENRTRTIVTSRISFGRTPSKAAAFVSDIYEAF